VLAVTGHVLAVLAHVRRAASDAAPDATLAAAWVRWHVCVAQASAADEAWETLRELWLLATQGGLVHIHAPMWGQHAECGGGHGLAMTTADVQAACALAGVTREAMVRATDTVTALSLAPEEAEAAAALRRRLAAA
jgi:hypothetical protein